MEDLIKLNARAAGHYVFLFTDIEGSTRRWAMFPSEMAAAIARHDSTLRKVVSAAGGAVFKTSGDGSHALFATVSEALAAAANLQNQMETENFTAVEGIKLRIGVHCGPAEFRDNDYFGLTLGRTARITAAAHGGQVLVSAAAAEAAGLMFSLRSLGMHRLRDLTQAQEIFQLAGSGLAAEFPPLRALHEKPNNLPLQPNSFLGRESELKELRVLLSKHKLVTLLGPAGIGKTRLSLQAAADALDAYLDGAWFVDLAGLNEPAQVAPTVAATLNVKFNGSGNPDEELAISLRGSIMLIILDNCEHLIEATSSLAAALLQRTGGITVLATSRSPLRVPGEQSFAVPTLAVPEVEVLPDITVETAERYSSVKLFLDRARLVLPSFTLDENNATEIAAICQRLDGIALAIELAAARARLMRPKELLARMSDRFRLLTGGARTNTMRQQTLRAAIDWSFSLLNENERVAFRRIGVFAGSFDMGGAESVIAGKPLNEGDVLELVSGLMDKSLITRLTAQDRPPRYRLLESIRHYALEKLEDSGEANALHIAHARHVVAEFGEARRRYADTDTVVWMADLRPAIENLQAALTWAFSDRGDASIAIALVARLWPIVCEVLIDWGAFRTFVRRALELLTPETSSEDAAWIWLNSASDSSCTARVVAASAETAQRLFYLQGDAPMEGLAASIAAYYLMTSGETALAQVPADAARAILQRIPPSLTSARMMYILGAYFTMAARGTPEFQEVHSHYNAALEIFKKYRNQTGILEVSSNLADEQALSGDYVGAIESTKRNAEHHRARRDWRGLNCDLVNQACFWLLAGNDAAAARAAREALPSSLEPFDQGWSAAFTGSIALLAARSDVFATAAKLAGYTNKITIQYQQTYQTVEQLVWDALMALFTQAERLGKMPASAREQLMAEGETLLLEDALKLAHTFLCSDRSYLSDVIGPLSPPCRNQ